GSHNQKNEKLCACLHSQSSPLFQLASNYVITTERANDRSHAQPSQTLSVFTKPLHLQHRNNVSRGDCNRSNEDDHQQRIHPRHCFTLHQHQPLPWARRFASHLLVDVDLLHGPRCGFQRLRVGRSTAAIRLLEKFVEIVKPAKQIHDREVALHSAVFFYLVYSRLGNQRLQDLGTDCHSYWLEPRGHFLSLDTLEVLPKTSSSSGRHRSYTTSQRSPAHFSQRSPPRFHHANGTTASQPGRRLQTQTR
ncbi:hypothetical protein BKA61DRAFT_129699, partial [Leptodontidium sp. MPI-SDFR-AT-0119]